ncbi:MAG TPA: YdeI/OmpD-associated family protein [Vicinamibacterales bacterium]|nr:YdeI/OmpD-associated family protein [Vicinamibacterales bacterium]
MATRDPRIDAYIAKAQPFARPILARFRKAMHAGCPGVTETLKWSVPAFEHHGMLGGMAAFKAHCIFGFWKAPLMKTVAARKDRIGRYGRLASIDAMPGEKALIAMVKEAAALNEAGVTLKRAPKLPKPAPKTPSYMLAAIRKNRKALAAYQAFSPSHKREYVEWIMDAKTDETRARRLQTAVQWMADGRSRNWKYQR